MNRTFLQTAKRFFEPIWNFKLILLKTIIANSQRYLYTVTNIFFVQKIVSIIENGQIELFYKYIIYYLIFAVAFYIIGFLTKYWGSIQGSPILQQYLQNIYIKKYISLDNNSIEKMGTGKMISIVERGFNIWVSLSFDIVNRICSLVIMAVTTVIVVGGLGYEYLFYLILFICAILAITGFLSRYSLLYRRKRVEKYTEYSRHLVKIIMSKFEILQNSKTNQELKVLGKDMNDLYDININLNFYTFFMYTSPRIFISIVTVSLFLTIGVQVMNGILQVSIFVGIMLFINYVSNMLFEMVEFYRMSTEQFTQVEKLWNTFDEIKENPGLYIGKDFELKKGDIVVENLGFAYTENVFENLSLNIHGGKKTAFVGVSGSGKSTLIKLIAGYLQPTAGSISVDGQNLNDVNLQSYYLNIGYLTQDPSVFDGSVIENLTYGSRNVPTEEELATAVKLSKCDFIYDFKDGFETQIGEKGVRLSGGQKQRLAIAKIFLKNPGIILLDEPTSALDSFSEDEITTAFSNLFVGRTVIVIAHRLQTVKNSDDIIVFEKGKIIERGNHVSLLETKGVYSKMLELQSGF